MASSTLLVLSLRSPFFPIPMASSSWTDSMAPTVPLTHIDRPAWFVLDGIASKEVSLMQRFMARLSSPVDKAAFERSWQSDPALSDEPRVEFSFVGQTVSAVVHSDY